MTSDDDAVRSSGPSAPSLVVPAVSEPRHSTMELEGLTSTLVKTPSLQRAMLDGDVLSSFKGEIVTSVVSNETMKQGASSTVI